MLSTLRTCYTCLLTDLASHPPHFLPGLLNTCIRYHQKCGPRNLERAPQVNKLRTQIEGPRWFTLLYEVILLHAVLQSSNRVVS